MRLTAILLLVLIEGLAGCGGDSGSPSPAPSNPTPPPPAPVQPAMFSDPASSFSTPDVRDVDEQIVQFDVATNSLVWTDGQRFPGYPVSGNFVAADKHFQVRFGTKDGQRRAYFTETASATICDIEVSGGQLTISATNVRVPGGS